ncbi:unnamed protein product [Adineta steineri]|uniref:EGF-like domain-containing protein n=1 Tax=Adineta steineri TaxID=433720 RepID=A0A814A659_9BILA|nr:unnamed protein product [Adineta steineri]
MDVLELPRPVINFLRTMAKESCRYVLSWDIFGGTDTVTLTLTWKLIDNDEYHPSILKSSQQHTRSGKYKIGTNFENLFAKILKIFKSQISCTPNCMNNGTCLFSNVCLCTSEWNGTYCEIPICSPPCENFGNCTSPGVCTCYYGWTGSYCQIVQTILWTFDNTLNDLSGQFIGVGYNSPTYTAGINGYGSALALNGIHNQCVIVYPYLNMSYMSFTWEFWIYPTIALPNDTTFISQCFNVSKDQCLLFMIRYDKILFSFWYDDVSGLTVIPVNKWSHMTLIYDLITNKKFIYLNGILEHAQHSNGSLSADFVNLTIGCRKMGKGATYDKFFTGYIDQMLYNSRVKNASEILNDATLVTYHRFLSNASLMDSGPNYINGSWGGGAVSIPSGIVNQAIDFPTNGSYFQLSELVLLGTSNWPLSLSLWFKINSLTETSSIAYLSDAIQCMKMITLLYNGTIQIQIFNGNKNNIIFGPVIHIGTWNHIIYTFSTVNGMRLYVNGSLYRSVITTYSTNDSPVTLTFGNSLFNTTCGYLNQQFYGSIDEVRLYSRELNATDIIQLYTNP